MLHAHPTRTLLIALAALIALGVLTFVLGMNFVSLYRPASGPDASGQAAFPADIPAPTPKDYVTAQKGFQYIVSYTDGGFAPKTLSVEKGEIVRFTNNSDNTLRLSLGRAQITSLKHGEYYEYTFANAGTFTYSDSNNKMTVTVK